MFRQGEFWQPKGRAVDTDAGCYLIKLNMSVPSALAIPMLERFAKKILARLGQKKCIKMYIGTLYVTAKKKWKQLKCPSKTLLLEKVNSYFV